DAAPRSGAAPRATRQQRRSATRLAGRARLACESLESRALLAGVVPGYSVSDFWGSGFQGAITLDNQTATAIPDWKLSFDSTATITSIWDAKIVSRVGTTYTVANVGWNATIDAGKKLGFGFVATPPTAGVLPPPPTGWVLNGAALGGTAPALPVVSVAGTSVAEGAAGSGGRAVFAVTLSRAVSTPVTVSYATADGTATAGSDYTAATGTITFPAGSTRQEVAVAVIGDATVEPDETFALKLTAAQGASLGQSTATATITNDDTPPAGQGVTATFSIVNQWQGGFQGQVTLKNGGPTALSGWRLGFTAPWSISSLWNGTIDGRTAVSGGTSYVVRDAGWNGAVPVGGAVSFGFSAATTASTVAAPTNWTLNGAPLGGTTPPPAPLVPVVTVAGATVTEGAAGATARALFAVTLSQAATAPVTVSYATANGTATAGSDYTAATGTVTFPVGSTRQEVAVAVIGDAQVESDETFSLVLTAPQNATLGQATATGRIVNDDVAPPPDPGTLPIARHDRVLAAYFPEWGIYGRNFQVADVPAEKLTHLIYSFLDLKSDGNVALFDSYAAVEKRFPAGETVSGEADLWYYPPGDPRATQTVWGNFNQLAQLKEKYPHLRVSIAVGGWTLSDHFSTVCSTATGRETFAASLVKFLETYRMFDGIDFDWEYPGGGGEGGNSASPADGRNYALLLATFRAKLDGLEARTGRRYEISVAAPAGVDKIANFNAAGLAPSVAFFNVMTYDFHGTWETTTGHLAAFTADPAGYDIRTAVAAYAKAGVDPRKIVLGAPMYTRAWKGVIDGGDGGYAEKSAGAAPGSFEPGNYDYKELLAKLQAAGSTWKLHWDDRAQAAYLYSGTEGIFSSFETPTTIAQKAQWASDSGLGGMMFWDISNDATTSPESLLTAAYSSWVIDESFASIRSRSRLTGETIIGGDGVITPLAPGW
ncbi:MAG: glycosyl hydrolase family 18 protein, partial [Planctomycetota bacterium]